MPLPIVTPSLFNGQGLAATVNEFHAQPGNHIRVNTHPLLGLPVAPFIVWRGVIKNGEGLKLQTDVVFHDDELRVLTPPFTLTPERPVTAVLSLDPGQMCIWARVSADPIGSPDDGGGLLAEARVSTAEGPVPVARRNTPAFSFNAPGIVEIRLTGRAAIVGVQWLAARDIPHASFHPWTVLNLPHAAGPRYASIQSPVKQCEQRTRLQAPKRRPLQDVANAVTPGGAPFATELDELDRVQSLLEPLIGPLDKLITDLSVPPLQQREQSEAFDENGRALGTLDMSRLDSLYQGQLDPGTASYLGYKGLDTDFVEQEPLMVFYWIEGYFRDFFPPPVIDLTPGVESEIDRFDALINALPSAHRIGNKHKLISALEGPINRLGNIELDPDNLAELEDHNDYIGLGSLLVVDRQASPLLPRAPGITSNRHVDWIPVPPPEARREARIELGGIERGALLAGKKRNLPGGQPFVALNKANDKGFHLPLVLGLNAADEDALPGVDAADGFIADRQADATRIRYFVAQQDRFGRWSQWTSGINRPGDRPAPPVPVLQAYYRQPDNPASDQGLIFGKVAVPPLEALAPAAFPLQRLDIDTIDLATGNADVEVVSIRDPLSPPEELGFEFKAPALSPTEQRQVRLVARWLDTAGTSSPDSEPVVLTLTDPRPPEQLDVPDTLLYSGRPDITGLSQVEHSWTPAAGQAGFAVYYSDENRLHAHLQAAAADNASSAEATVLSEIDAAADAAARATIYRNHAPLFDAALFERLDDVVIDAPGNRKRFQHAVSGSLRVLNVYRIAAESASNARADLSTLPLLIFGVPNADPPSVPVLTVAPGNMADNSDTYSAIIDVSLVPGVTAASTYRLRRTSLGAGSVERLPVVETGPMAAPDEDGVQHATTTDEGPVLISRTATLKPWVRYQWVAEVQGADEPGSGEGGTPRVPGIWSAPSEPVSLVLTPPLAPAAPIGLTATGVGFGAGRFSTVTLQFEHTGSLSGGEAGMYRVRLFRRLPDEPLTALPDVPVAGHGPFSISGLDARNPADEVVSGTLYRVQIIDPLGRSSDAAEATLF